MAEILIVNVLKHHDVGHGWLGHGLSGLISTPEPRCLLVFKKFARRGDDAVCKRFWPDFLRSLAAVVAGNFIYFFVLMRHLPKRAQHSIGRVDLGLLIDFWLCLAIWGILRLAARRRGSRG
jgi:hypothetical protein